MASTSAIRHLPNALTILRLIAIPPFVWLLANAEGGQSVAAGIIFVAASLTDWFDGYLARRLDVQSRFGRLADPLADRLLIGSAVILLWYHDRMHAIITIAILGRDAFLVAGFAIVGRHGYELRVTQLGKTATFILMGAIAALILTAPGTIWPNLLLVTGVVLSLAAAFDYVRTVRRA